MIFKYKYLLAVIILSLLSAYQTILPGYFPHHDDLQVMRIFEMRRCFEDLQIPCRWVPDMGYGNGFPLFNYYSPLPYYIGAIFSILVGYVASAKLLFFIPLFLGGIFMFILTKEFFEERLAFLATVLFIFAPYRALDIYVRGAVAESFAIAIVPLVFYFSYKFLKNRSKLNFVAFSLSITGLLLSHNIMTLFFIPLVLIWILIWVIADKKFISIVPCTIALFLGFGLSAFFILPAFLEKDLVNVESLVQFDLNFRTHFVTINQLLFNRSWGYGSSTYGSDDTISFQIGWPHILLIFISGLTFIYSVIFKKIDRKNLVLTLFFGVSFTFSVFMTHIRSSFIWESIRILEYTQFPWRFLSVVIFSGSILGVVWLNYLTGRLKWLVVITVVVLTVALNFNYFKPLIHFNMTDGDKLSGDFWETQQKAGILDYLPKTASQPLEGAPIEPIVNGDVKVKNFINKSNHWSMQIDAKKESRVEVPVFDFPNWTVYVDNQEIRHSHDNHLGRIAFSIDKGDHLIEGVFNNTSIRSLANIITLVSSITLMSVYLLWKKLKVL